MPKYLKIPIDNRKPEFVLRVQVITTPDRVRPENCTLSVRTPAEVTGQGKRYHEAGRKTTAGFLNDRPDYDNQTIGGWQGRGVKRFARQSTKKGVYLVVDDQESMTEEYKVVPWLEGDE